MQFNNKIKINIKLILKKLIISYILYQIPILNLTNKTKFDKYNIKKKCVGNVRIII